MSDYEIPLADPEDWEDETGLVDRIAEEAKKDAKKAEVERIKRDRAAKKAAEKYADEEMSDLALSYVLQLKDLKQQLQQEYLKVQRLEMAIRGFSAALQEELSKEDE